EQPDQVPGRELARGEAADEVGQSLGALGVLQLGERAERQAEAPAPAAEDGLDLAAVAVGHVSPP
ncbi:hypothetical protein J8J40_23755, partial [Mycobacterium tuberculosis]|nr:hypothetical protein [Mycobacterium tuberculosis]